MRTAIVATGVCLVSWGGLFLGAGNIGLQRSVAVGPGTLVEVPLGLILAAALAFLAAFTLLVLARTPQIVPWHLVVAVIVGDMVGALILAPLAVGELTPLNAPIVFLALAALGAQPMAAFLGAHTARRVSNDRVQHTGAG